MMRRASCGTESEKAIPLSEKHKAFQILQIFKKNQTTGEFSEIDALRETVRNARMPEAVETAALKEVDRLAKNSPSSTEYTIGMNYLDYLISLPWNRMTEDRLDIAHAEAVLDEEHYGLKDIKLGFRSFLYPDFFFTHA